MFTACGTGFRFLFYNIEHLKTRELLELLSAERQNRRSIQTTRQQLYSLIILSAPFQIIIILK